MARLRRTYRRKRYGVVRRKSRWTRRKRVGGRRRRRIQRGIPRKSIVYRHVEIKGGSQKTPSCRLDSMPLEGGFHSFRCDLAKDVKLTDIEKKLYSHFRILKVYIKMVPEFVGPVGTREMASSTTWVTPNCYKAMINADELPGSLSDMMAKYKVKAFDPLKVQKWSFTPRFINSLLWNPTPKTAWLAISKLSGATLNPINTPCVAWSDYRLQYYDNVKNEYTDCPLEFRTIMSYEMELYRQQDLPGVQSQKHSFGSGSSLVTHVYKNPNYQVEK
ncbi:capsid protein [Caesalpinia ferrea associated virus]|uniref:Capsid protein n=1 Tax=Caesalpinia ferrea associated virus TaxID=2771212 RepID=A0A7S6HG83_9CIRC|nr:capsid protein [Caesalpinia ferrea associated virus]QNT09335.1 capsid protein [Caesalpinia ferrea associated virus]